MKSTGHITKPLRRLMNDSRDRCRSCGNALPRDVASYAGYSADGEPLYVDLILDKLIDTITEMNRGKGVVIHVITFSKEEGQKLRGLAERNGGQCVVRGWTGEPPKDGKGAGGKPEEKPPEKPAGK